MVQGPRSSLVVAYAAPAENLRADLEKLDGGESGAPRAPGAAILSIRRESSRDE